MTKITNNQTKMLVSMLASMLNRFEWCMQNTNKERGETFTQMDMIESCEATIEKVVKGHVVMFNQFNGVELKHLMIEMNEAGAQVNHLRNKAKAYEEYANTEFAKHLHAVLRYHTTKSDHTRNSKDIRKTIVVSQKVEYMGTLKNSVKKAVELGGLDDYEEMKKFAKEKGISLKTCGVVYDYYLGTYKAVFMDYSL